MLAACNQRDANSEAPMEDPSRVHPPEEAVPDSMSIKKDSVIVPDSGNRDGRYMKQER